MKGRWGWQMPSPPGFVVTARQLLKAKSISSGFMFQVVGFADRDTLNMKPETPGQMASRFTVRQAHGSEFYRRANNESSRSGVSWRGRKRKLPVSNYQPWPSTRDRRLKA
jgi:hypothetical protein